MLQVLQVPVTPMSGVARYTVVGPPVLHGLASATPDALESPESLEADHPLGERRSIERRIRDAAFVEVVDRGPGVLLVLAAANLLFAVWQGGLQQRPLVLLCAVLSLLWLLVCLRVQQGILLGAVLHRTTLRRDRRAWVRMMSVALLTPALNLALNLHLEGRVEQELTVVLVLVCLYAAAVWAAVPALARVAVASAGLASLVCLGLGEARLGITLLVAAVLALWLQRQMAAVWQRATRSRLLADDLSAALARERDAAVRAQHDANRFVATASHDLRQPMHALGLFVSTLERRVRGGPDEALVRNMVRSIEALDQSFGAMLDMSRLDAGSMEANFQFFALRDVFRRLHLHFAGVAEAAGLSLRFSPGGKSVRSDPQLLERVLGNLIQNALRHTREGGVVVVARTRARQICIEVWDTGSGIAAEELPRIFDEFYQVRDGTRRRQRGLGLGLAIVKRLVQLMGHTLTVASCPGRGTVFRLGVTTSDFDEVERVTAAADTVPLPVYAARTILVIDDEDSIREGLGVVLSEWGYEPHLAATLEEAAACARMLGDTLDLVLSDLHLADGEDGLEAIERVRAVCGGKVPAVVITGDTTADEMHRVTAAGVPLLFKPVQPRKLMSTLRRLTH